MARTSTITLNYSTVGKTTYNYTHDMKSLISAYSIYCFNNNIKPKYPQRAIKKGTEAERYVRHVIEGTPYDYKNMNN